MQEEVAAVEKVVREKDVYYIGLWDGRPEADALAGERAS
jgi:hypothetical protein